MTIGTSRPRIAMISEHASPLALLGSEDAGGQNVYVAEVSRHLVGLGYDVDVFTRLDREGAAQVNDWLPGVRVIYLHAGPAAALKKDAMWAHMPRFRDKLLAFVTDTETVYGLIHANFWMSGWVGCEVKPVLGVPLVEIFHALGKVKRLHQGEADTSPQERDAVERRIIATADRIIAQCPAEVDELAALYGADTRNVRVVPSAVNTEVFAPVAQNEARSFLGLSGSEKIVVYVGRMLPRKGIDNLLRAAALVLGRTQIPLRVLLVGGETSVPDAEATPEIGRLQALARQLAISERVTFVGKREQRLLKYYYSAGDVAVTTPWYEPYGLTPLEAMACGRPAIGSSVGGIKFTILDGKTGFLVPANDPAALSRRLEQVLMDDSLRLAMGRAARRRTEDRFTWQQVALETAKVYREVLLMADRPRANDQSPRCCWRRV